MKKIEVDMTNDIKVNFEVKVDGEDFNVEVKLPESFKRNYASTLVNNHSYNNVSMPQITSNEPQNVNNEQIITAPMPGNIIEYKKQVGDNVKKGDVIVILEAMKMYNNLYANIDGKIENIPFKSGDNVKKYDTLCIIK